MIQERTLSDFVAATSIKVPNKNTTRKACHTTGEESPQPLIMIDRKASEAHVVGNDNHNVWLSCGGSAKGNEKAKQYGWAEHQCMKT